MNMMISFWCGRYILTHQASGLASVCPGGGDHWGSRYIRSTGTSSAQPAGCRDRGPDPSEQTAMSRRMRCPPDLRLPSLESLPGQEDKSHEYTSHRSGEGAHRVTFRERWKTMRRTRGCDECLLPCAAMDCAVCPQCTWAWDLIPIRGRQISFVLHYSSR